MFRSFDHYPHFRLESGRTCEEVGVCISALPTRPASSSRAVVVPSLSRRLKRSLPGHNLSSVTQKDMW